MRRRRFLAGAVTLPLFGGCLSVTGGSETATSTNERTDTTVERDSRPPATQDGDLSFDAEADEPFDQFTVGDGVERDDRKPHEVVLWNDGSEREIEVSVQSDADGDPPFDRRLTFPADGYLTLELTERVGYRVAAGVSDGPEYVFDLSDSVVDCNDSQTTVRVDGAGEVTYLNVSTAMACE